MAEALNNSSQILLYNSNADLNDKSPGGVGYQGTTIQELGDFLSAGSSNLSGKQDISEKNQANGYAGLDANSKILSSAVPSALSANTGTFTQSLTSAQVVSIEFTAQLFLINSFPTNFYNFGSTPRAGQFYIENTATNAGFLCSFIVANNTLFIDISRSNGSGFGISTAGTSLNVQNTTGAPNAFNLTIRILNIK